MNLVGVKYIGVKAAKKDNVAGTGLIWTQGQIHVVPAAIVPKFQEHPTVWEIVPVGEDDMQSVGLVVDVLGETPEQIADNAEKQAVVESILTQEDLPASFDPMSKSEIAAFAQRNYGVQLDFQRMTKDALIQTVRTTHNARVQG